MGRVRSSKSPIAQALGDDFQNLHAAVRRHYAAPTHDIRGTMDVVYVKSAIKPLALVSYKLLGAPVPYSGRDVETIVRNRIDDSGAMHWVRNFIQNASFPEAITFGSRMVWSGDGRIIEFTRYGVGVESDMTVDGSGSLVYDVRRYVVSVPFLGLIVRVPTWLTPFGGGRTKEIGETEESFRVEFEMVHPIFGRTLGYMGRFWFESPE
jgi:hypothetical protein